MLNSNNYADVMQIVNRGSERKQTSTNYNVAEGESFKSKLENAQKNVQKNDTSSSDNRVDTKKDISEDTNFEQVTTNKADETTSNVEDVTGEMKQEELSQLVATTIIPEMLATVPTNVITEATVNQNAQNAQDASQAVLPTTTTAENVQVQSAQPELVTDEAGQVKLEVNSTTHSIPFSEVVEDVNTSETNVLENATQDVDVDVDVDLIQTKNEPVVDLKEIKSQMEAENLVNNKVVQSSETSKGETEQNATNTDDETNLKAQTDVLPDTNVKAENRFEVSFKSEDVAPAETKPYFNQAEQISNNLMNAIENGKQEFTMQLEPENLGKITVKLVLEGGNLSLDVITSNPRTQGILSEQVAGLREILAKADYQINDVNITNDGQHMYQGFSNSFTSSDAHRQNSNNHNHSNTYASYGVDMFEEDAISPIITDIASLRMRMNYVV